MHLMSEIAGMQSRTMIDGLAEHWGLQPKAFLNELPDTKVSIARWQHANTRGDYHSPTLRYDNYLLSLILRPMQAKAWVNRREVWSGPIAPNSVRIVHAELESSWQSTSAFDLLHIFIPRQTFSAMLGDEADGSGRVLFDDPLYRQDDMVCQIGRRIVQIMAQPGPYTQSITDGLCKALVGHLLDRYAIGASSRQPHSLSQSQLNRVLDLINTNLSGELTVSQMAQVADLSEFHFARQFRRAVGQSPHQFLLAARAEHAKDLLMRTRRNILDIALDCGFKDASHFSRVFRQFAGVTPSQFRRLN